MGSYGTDSGERVPILAFLAIFSAGIAWAASAALEAADIQLPFWIEGLSLLSLYGAIVWIFDTWAWRQSSVHALFRVKIPYLAGEWHGSLDSSHGGGTSRDDVNVTIRQTWTRMSIRLRTSDSQSFSTVAAISSRQDGEPELTYQYLNEPRATAPATMHSHRGTVTLRLVGDSRLEGEYYTGRDRRERGTLALERID